ncbi:beta family protein [Streptomyces roseolus]|uniref:beta family protein n=1 Tax=Streptomyces roseolus TaxID=67358 RepID=UPI0037899A27
MSGPLYVPVLPAKQHACQAYRQLIPAVQAAVVPLWNLPPRAGAHPDALAVGVRDDLWRVRKAHRHHPAWVDCPLADEAQQSALAGALSADADVSPLRPVTGPDRSEAHQAAMLEHARSTGNGLGIRVLLPGEWDDAVGQGVRELVSRAGPAVETDLLLDLDAVRADRTDTAKETLRALEALVPLTPWRTAVVLGGAFPAGLPEHGTDVEPRWDWQVWRDLHRAGRDFLRALAYGDYGIDSTRAIARGPSTNGGGPPWGVLRYTTDESYVLVKVPTRGPDRSGAIRAAARDILALPDFRGPAASAGETWIRDCAHGHGPEGTGNVGVWLRVGNIQHMTHVVRSLRP